jgi:uncharacterized protein (DUF1778 family)
MPAPQLRSGNINLRVAPDQLGIIDRAAASRGKTRTQFILDTAVQAAEETLLDRRYFVLNKAQWEAFNKALDAPVKPNKGLEELLGRRAPWE